MAASAPTRPQLALSIDLEEYFQVEAMAACVRPEDWPGLPSRVERSTERVLALLAEAGAQATFFVVGWVAERHPRLIGQVAAAGHELGCHSYWHRPIFQLTPAEFRDDTRRAQAAIEAVSGRPLAGYRAPNFSIHPDMVWAWEILAAAGFRYDSSLHPIRHPLYGAARAPRAPFELPEFGMWELPLATVALAGQRLPMAGGAYWRLAPWSYTRAALAACLRQQSRPICYLHPWELDPDQPRAPMPLTRRLRHYTGLAGMEGKLRRLLRAYSAVSIASLYAPELSAAPVAAARCPSEVRA